MMEKQLAWEKDANKPNYQYLRLGSGLQEHFIFELTPEKELNIFLGNRYECRDHQHKITEDGKRLLKKWVNAHL